MQVYLIYVSSKKMMVDIVTIIEHLHCRTILEHITVYIHVFKGCNFCGIHHGHLVIRKFFILELCQLASQIYMNGYVGHLQAIIAIFNLTSCSY